MLKEINEEFINKDINFYIAEQDVEPGSLIVDKIKRAMKDVTCL